MLRHLLYRLQDFFGLSPKEARSALILMVLSLALIVTPSLFRQWVLPRLGTSGPSVSPQRLDSLVAELEAQAASAPAGTSAPEGTSRASATARPVRLFAFDPNHATPDQLQELGIPRFLALRIDNYRQKGGRFRKKEDLLRIYDFPAELYKRLEPYMVLNEVPARQVPPPSYSREESTPATPPASRVPGRPALVPFDINTADTTQLIRLRGIGSTLSLRIVRFRDALGGFYSPAQYAEVYGLDSLALAELHRYALVQSTPQQLNINTATAQELARHPYLRNRRLNEILVRYREQHGRYQSAEDLKKIKILDENTLQKIAPYLTYD
ncbi:hypothetical protein GCM10027275_47580 [Rhabdobacter roseus]|uniref:Competence ComEA-like helix-hairpin-helix protein n=1 Tax=Rhabdobacter roseus TaxID=1655419 RepID=A0A840TR51_9BACT|nr:helix-hairpin-helix domain-containing protein [Rhabdobacter roseus]MBB5286361.1 competence ComEA-like helix-hairpin-helix protein [Rhabdobacter roseus]